MNVVAGSPAPAPHCIVCGRIIPTYAYPSGPHGPYHAACSGEVQAQPVQVFPVYPQPYTSPYPWWQYPQITWTSGTTGASAGVSTTATFGIIGTSDGATFNGTPGE